jgi:protein-tyrosine phosphatase
MVKNFRFEEEGVLALSGVPESPEAVDWLHDEVQRRMDELSIEWTPLYVEDFTRGVPADFADTLEFIHRRSREGRSVLLH